MLDESVEIPAELVADANYLINLIQQQHQAEIPRSITQALNQTLACPREDWYFNNLIENFYTGEEITTSEVTCTITAEYYLRGMQQGLRDYDNNISTSKPYQHYLQNLEHYYAVTRRDNNPNDWRIPYFIAASKTAPRIEKDLDATEQHREKLITRLTKNYQTYTTEINQIFKTALKHEYKIGALTVYAYNIGYINAHDYCSKEHQNAN